MRSTYRARVGRTRISDFVIGSCDTLLYPDLNKCCQNGQSVIPEFVPRLLCTRSTCDLLIRFCPASSMKAPQDTMIFGVHRRKTKEDGQRSISKVLNVAEHPCLCNVARCAPAPIQAMGCFRHVLARSCSNGRYSYPRLYISSSTQTCDPAGDALLVRDIEDARSPRSSGLFG
jgi:hypothetical protein